jgi:glycosyltransferase involved in cell wall biosynthesis
LSDLHPRTIFHLDHASTWSGSEQQLLHLHQGLLALGLDSRVVCQTEGALEDRLRRERLPHYAMRMIGGLDPGGAWRLRNLLHDPATVLHAHTPSSVRLGLWARGMGARAKLVASHRGDFPVGKSWWGRRKGPDRRIDRYLPNSSAAKSNLARAGVSTDSMLLVPHGIDFTRFADVQPDLGWRLHFGLEPGELLFTNVAALAPRKDQPTLLRAFRRFLDLGGQGKLVVLGEGESRPGLERLKRQLGLQDHAFLPGFEPEILPKMRAADVFVASDRTDGLGSAILDAMALARPVVATSAGGIVDAVDQGETGILAPPEEPAALARGMLDLQQSAASRQRMGLAGQRKVEQFDVRRTVELTLAAYRELFDPRPGPVNP